MKHRNLPCLFFFCFVICAAWSVGGAPPSLAQDNAPILSLNPGGHTAVVNQVLFSPDGKELISVGDDKVIRVWNAATGDAVRTIRGQIGDGPAGKLYAAALSPDGQTLAVGGYLEYTGAKESLGYYIRLIDLHTGHVIRLLSGPTKPTLALAFSPDGKTVASGDASGTVWMFDAATGAGYPLKGHTRDVYGVAFSPDTKQVASASLDGTVRLWNLSSRKGRTLDGKSDNGYRCLAYSPDGKWIAAGGFDKQVRIWDGATGALKQSLPPQEKYVTCIAFSPDSKILAAGFGSVNPEPCSVRLWSVGSAGVDPTPVEEFAKHTDAVEAVAFSPDGKTVASAGGLANDIYLWAAQGGAVAQHIASTGGATQDVAWASGSAKITWNSQTSTGPVRHTFDLVDRSLIPNPDQPWQKAVVTQNGLTLSADGSVVKISGGGQIALRSPTDRVRCFTWTPDGNIIIGSNFGLLSLYDRKGDPIRGFLGHTGDVLSVSVSPDGKYLVSASRDQTVRIWPLSPTAENDQHLVFPLLSIFVGSDREWVAWTHSGYYTCSTNGENIMGWQINHGDDQSADYYPASRFHQTFFRDDIIGHLLQAGSEDAAIALADKGRTEKTDLTKTAANIAQFAPPTVEILSPADGATAADPQVALKIRITDPNNRALKSLKLTDNERVVPPPDGNPISPQAGEMTLTAALAPGDNNFSVVVDNDAGAESVPATVKVVYGAGEHVKVGSPTLYLLSIGVSQYLDPANSLEFPAKDSKDITTLFSDQVGPGKMFSKIVATNITDKQAKRDTIIHALVQLREQAKTMGPNDYTVVFVAGHGTNDDLDQYFFAPYDIDADDVDSTGVQWLSFSQTLAQLPGKVILMLDTCHSAGVEGKINKKDGYGRFLVATSLARFNNESPVITFASCGKGELSEESDAWNNGAFTKALVEGLSGKADADHNGIVTITELSKYLDTRVAELTKDAQHPVLSKPISVSANLPLAVVGPIVGPGVATAVPSNTVAKAQ